MLVGWQRGLVRILAWNVNHRTRQKAIPADVPASILSLNPDVVVLTEYVEGRGHSSLLTELSKVGISTEFHTPFQPGHNQVLVVSRSTSSLGTFVPPMALGHAASNCVHAQFVSPFLNLIGMRVPMYKSSSESRSYWDWFGPAVGPLLNSRTVIIGDLNTDPQRSKSRGFEDLKRLVASGWQLPNPVGEWSYISTRGTTSRLDHALVSPAVSAVRAEYIASAHGFAFAGSGNSYLSDHAPLILDIADPVTTHPLRQLLRT